MRKKKKKKTWKEKIKEFFSSLLFLEILFVILLVVVVCLGVLVHQKRSSNEELHANIVIPIYKKDADFEFSISAVDLKKSKEYVFKVINYMKDIVNEEDIVYSVNVQNPTDSVITLTKNDDETNLMKSQENTLLENEVLSSKEEKEIYYYVRFKKVGKLKNKDLITVHIAS